MALRALCLVLFAVPLEAVVVSNVPACSLCGTLPGAAGNEFTPDFNLEASLAGAVFTLGTPTTGFFEIDETRLALQALAGTLIVQAGVVVPAHEHPSSAMEGVVFAQPSCQDCGGAPSTADSSITGTHLGIGFPLVALLALAAVAFTVPLIYIVRSLRSLHAEEHYLKDRWGVRTRVE